MSGSEPFDRVGFFPSFPVPMPAPTTDISASPSLALCFNEEWLPYIIGALTCLMRAETYTGTMAEILDAVSNAMTIPALIGDCESMRTWRQDGCHLYTTLNGIETLIYNGQECVDANIADGTLAKANTGYIGDIPHSTCQVYTVNIDINKTWVAPNVVNSGDTIQLSNWQGGATDLGLANTFWTCPGGAAYLLGACAGPTRPPNSYGTDPLTTAPHLCVIGQIGTTYYDIWGSNDATAPGLFTVPSGIVNQPLRLMMNVGSAVGLVATGEMWGEVTICNHAYHCHKFDFSVSDQGFSAFVYGGITRAQYAGGGWQSKDSNRLIQFSSGIFPGTVAARRITIHFASAAPSCAVEIQYPASAAPSGTDWNASQTISGNEIVITGSTSLSSMWINVDTGGASLAGKIIDYILLEFDGSNPWGADNCV